MAGDRHICLIALSISDIHPRAGVGRCPLRMILAVAGDGSGPIIGEEDRPNGLYSSAYSEVAYMTHQTCSYASVLPE